MKQQQRASAQCREESRANERCSSQRLEGGAEESGGGQLPLSNKQTTTLSVRVEFPSVDASLSVPPAAREGRACVKSSTAGRNPKRARGATACVSGCSVSSRCPMHAPLYAFLFACPSLLFLCPTPPAAAAAAALVRSVRPSEGRTRASHGGAGEGRAGRGAKPSRRATACRGYELDASIHPRCDPPPSLPVCDSACSRPLFLQPSAKPSAGHTARTDIDPGYHSIDRCLLPIFCSVRVVEASLRRVSGADGPLRLGWPATHHWTPGAARCAQAAGGERARRERTTERGTRIDRARFLPVDGVRLAPPRCAILTHSPSLTARSFVCQQHSRRKQRTRSFRQPYSHRSVRGAYPRLPSSPQPSPPRFAVRRHFPAAMSEVAAASSSSNAAQQQTPQQNAHQHSGPPSPSKHVGPKLGQSAVPPREADATAARDRRMRESGKRGPADALAADR
jgi:hypothetical protein